MGITSAQREALDVVKDMIDKSNTSVPDYGTKIMKLILGILNIDCGVEYTITDITDITDIEGDKTIPINPDNGNDGIQINVPDWLKNMPTPPFVPGDRTSEPAPWEPRVWYNHEHEPIDAHKQEDVRYVTEVTCTDNKNGIAYTVSTTDAQYTGDFRDEQTSFNEK